jgi:succinate-acetate transporter protein
MILGAIGEWILGNTFPCVVFGSFGAFWVALTLTLTPYMGAAAPNKYTEPGGLVGPAFNNSFGKSTHDICNLFSSANSCPGFYLVCMGVLVIIYSICALRTNLILFLILFLLIPAFACLTAGYFHVALGNAAAAKACIIAGGALAFVICMLGWYIFAAILLASVDFPLNLPGKLYPLPLVLHPLIHRSLRSISHHQGRQRQEEGVRRRGLDTSSHLGLCVVCCSKTADGNLMI